MIEIIDNRKPKIRSIMARDIPLGFFFGRINSYKGLFIKTFTGVVYIADPSHVWAPSFFHSWERSLESWRLEIEEYQPLQDSSIKITIEG